MSQAEIYRMTRLDAPGRLQRMPKFLIIALGACREQSKQRTAEEPNPLAPKSKAAQFSCSGLDRLPSTVPVDPSNGAEGNYAAASHGADPLGQLLRSISSTGSLYTLDTVRLLQSTSSSRPPDEWVSEGWHSLIEL